MGLGSEWPRPALDQVARNPVVLVQIVDYLDHRLINRLVKENVRCHVGILRRQNKFKADRSGLVVYRDRDFASELDAVYFACAAFTDWDDPHIGGGASG